MTISSSTTSLIGSRLHSRTDRRLSHDFRPVYQWTPSLTQPILNLTLPGWGIFQNLLDVDEHYFGRDARAAAHDEENRISTSFLCPTPY